MCLHQRLPSCIPDIRHCRSLFGRKPEDCADGCNLFVPFWQVSGYSRRLLALRKSTKERPIALISGGYILYHQSYWLHGRQRFRHDRWLAEGVSISSIAQVWQVKPVAERREEALSWRLQHGGVLTRSFWANRGVTAFLTDRRLGSRKGTPRQVEVYEEASERKRLF